MDNNKAVWSLSLNKRNWLLRSKSFDKINSLLQKDVFTEEENNQAYEPK